MDIKWKNSRKARIVITAGFLLVLAVINFLCYPGINRRSKDWMQKTEAAKTGTDREPVFPHKKSIVEKTAARPLVIYRRFFSSPLFAAPAFIHRLYLRLPLLFAFFICGRRLYSLSLFVAAAFFLPPLFAVFCRTAFYKINFCPIAFCLRASKYY